MATDSSGIAKGTGIVSALTLASRFFGFIRDLVLARVFGAGPLMDAFFVAFRIPNLLRSVVGEGALTSAFIPVFSHESVKGAEASRAALRSVSSMLICFTVILSLLGIYWSSTIVDLIAPGFSHSDQQFERCVLLTQIMFPYIIFVSITALLNGAFNSIKIFGLGPIAQIAMNLATILGALAAAYFPLETGVYVLAYSVLAGGIVQVLVQLPALRRASLTILPSTKIFSASSKEVLKLMAPAILGAAVYQLSIFVNTALASVLGDGSVSWLSYADRLAQLPIGIFTVALGSVLLPTLSGAAARNSNDAFSKSLVDSLRFTSFVIVPVSCGMWIFSEPIVALLFERGAFNSTSTRGTALAVQAYSLGLWGVSCYSVAIRALIARKDTRTPMLVGLFTMALGVLLAVALMGPATKVSGGWIDHLVLNLQSLFVFKSLALGHVGVALASGLASTISLTIILFVVHRRERSLDLGTFVYSTLKAVISSGLAGLTVLVILPAELSNILYLLLGTTIFAGIFCLSSLILGSSELKQTLNILK